MGSQGTNNWAASPLCCSSILYLLKNSHSGALQELIERQRVSSEMALNEKSHNDHSFFVGYFYYGVVTLIAGKLLRPIILLE